MFTGRKGWTSLFSARPVRRAPCDLLLGTEKVAAVAVEAPPLGARLSRKEERRWREGLTSALAEVWRGADLMRRRPRPPGHAAALKQLSGGVVVVQEPRQLRRTRLGDRAFPSHLWVMKVCDAWIQSGQDSGTESKLNPAVSLSLGGSS